MRLVDLVGMDEMAWDVFSRGSAIRRAERVGFLCDVTVALGNRGAPEAVPALVRALEEPLVRGHAAWALVRIGSAGARGALISAVQPERDLFVLEQIEAVLTTCGSSET